MNIYHMWHRSVLEIQKINFLTRSTIKTEFIILTIVTNTIKQFCKKVGEGDNEE